MKISMKHHIMTERYWGRNNLCSIIVFLVIFIGTLIDILYNAFTNIQEGLLSIIISSIIMAADFIFLILYHYTKR